VNSAEKQLGGFIAKFAPDMQKKIRAVRGALRKRFPTATELVYDNYNFFVIGYSPTERPSDAILSIASQASSVSICFIQGVKLEDPTKRLGGGGKQVRSFRVESPSDLKAPDVVALLAAAEKNARVPFASSGPGELVIRSISAKQRPRRKA